MTALSASCRARRDNAELTQKELSDKIDVSPRQIARFESGDYHIPKWYKLALEGLFGKNEGTGELAEANLPPFVNPSTPENLPPWQPPPKTPGDNLPIDDTGIPAFLRRTPAPAPAGFNLGAKPEYLK